MGNIVTSLLTDASLRSASAVELTLINQAKIAAPWGDDPEL
ncbi:MAG TPA: hypothetical protein VIS56_02330 [Candidatus Saccharimonadales bacterium]